MSTEEETIESNISALAENIQRKGNNAYYYAHGMKVNGPQWDGKEEPRLLSSEVRTPSSKSYKHSITEYSWGDERKKVKIYIPFENAESIDDSNIDLSFEESRLNFRVVTSEEKEKVLVLSLNANIVGATFRKKPSEFVLTLVKETETAWYSLKKSP